MFCSEIVHGRRECRYFFFLGILPELKKNALEVLSLTFQTWSCAF